MPRKHKTEPEKEVDEVAEEEEVEETEPPKAKRKRGPVPGSEATVNIGGARVHPPKPPGVAAKVKARTFHGWVGSLVKRETQPHHFVLELADGESKTILLTRSRNGSVLIGECISTIETFEPVLVEAFSRNEETNEETTLGRWVFPVKETPPDETATPRVSVPTMPGYLPEEGDSDDIRLLKTSVHMIADAYRYNAEANKGMLDAMARVMEMQANAFARERESMTKTVQATEKLARIKRDKFRVSSGIPGASDVVSRGDDDDDEVEEHANGEQIFNAMAQTFATEYARRAASAASGVAAEAAATAAK